MIPRDLTKLDWNELHALRNKFTRNKSMRLLMGESYAHIDAQLRIVDRHIANFNQPPYIKRRVL